MEKENKQIITFKTNKENTVVRITKTAKDNVICVLKEGTEVIEINVIKHKSMYHGSYCLRPNKEYKLIIDDTSTMIKIELSYWKENGNK